LRDRTSIPHVKPLKDPTVSPTEELPSYEPLLAAYHNAFAAELQAIVASLPIGDGDRVVEMACGDGAYTPWLAARVGAKGTVTAVDVSPSYLEVARAVSARSNVAARIGHVAAPIEQLPLPRDSFDLVWCAQSLYSLPDQVEAIKTMASLARPGGTVAVLDNDTVHQLVLPWPVDIELAVRRAEFEAFGEEKKPADTYYVGRWLTRLFREAGLIEIQARSFTTTRQAPLGAPERAFLVAYLDELRERVANRLVPQVHERFLELADPHADAGLVNQPDLTLTCLDHVVLGRKG
jgi:ubiquinone/menaquinone biosynthesis C-methylase UbiE